MMYIIPTWDRGSLAPHSLYYLWFLPHIVSLYLASESLFYEASGHGGSGAPPPPFLSAKLVFSVGMYKWLLASLMKCGF